MHLEPNEHLSILESSKRGFSRILFGRTLLILCLLLFHFLLLFAVLMPLISRLPALFGGAVIFTGAMLMYVLNTREDPNIKLSWCIVIALLPVFGTLLYFFIRFDLGHRLLRRMLRTSMEESAAHIPDATAVIDELRQQDKDTANLAGYLYRQGGCPVFTNTEVEYFPLGEYKFARMLQCLEQAEHFIFLEYFVIGPSEMWSEILEVLARKAAQGVEVRVMYDGSCAVANLPYNYPQQLEKLGIQCKMFSPFRTFLSTHYNNRDHRKVLVIDGHTAFTGGVNIQDRYINRKQVYGHWKDTAVMVQGDGAQGFTLMFLQMWNATASHREFAAYLRPCPKVSAQGYVIPYGDSPLDEEHIGQNVYLSLLNQAKDYVYIMTPYLILNGEMLTALTFAAKRGVDVRLILPHVPDKKYAFVLAQSHYRELYEAGVKIYEYTPGFLHAKVFLSDDCRGVVGTINLDYRSLYLNFECAAYLYKVPALAQIREDFESTMAVSQLITEKDIDNQSLLTRLSGKALKLVAPLL